MYSMKKKKTVDPVPFDSYSPLLLNRRGRGVGGYKEFADGSLLRLLCVYRGGGHRAVPSSGRQRTAGAFYINFYMNGRAEGKTPSGERVIFECKGDPSGENFAASIRLQKPEAFRCIFAFPPAEALSRCAKERVLHRNGILSLDAQLEGRG